MDRINVRALHDVTLDIEDGDRLGLIGLNGAGKTTLLRVLAGIYYPSQGRAYSSGKVSALLDVSVGLNPEATGRENIILRGMYMNIHPREMRSLVDEIAEFTELGPYLDMPTRTYSAGMMVRLGFAVSTCIPPEILLMDEWLSAGDASFLDKAQKRMERFVGSSSILVLASHSMELLRKWCNRGVILRHGRIVAHGAIADVIAAYTGNPLQPAGTAREPDEIPDHRDNTPEWREPEREFVSATAETSELVHRLDNAVGERNEFLRQRDAALGERNELLRQRDLAIGLNNLQSDRLARYAHRGDVTARRAAIASGARAGRTIAPIAGTRDRILLFLYLAGAGGETLIDILIRNIDTKDFLVVDKTETFPSGLGTWSPLGVEKALARLQRPQIEDVRFLWGPYPPGIGSHLPKPCTYAILLRDPLERAISHHRALAAVLGKAEQTLEDAVLSCHPHAPLFIDNYMTRILSGVPALDPAQSSATTQHHPRVTSSEFERAARNLDDSMLAGVANQFDETLILLANDLCWSLSDMVYKPANTAESNAHAAETAKPVRDKILEWNRFDIALVERARAHLARRIATYPGDFQKDLALFRKINALFQQGAAVEDVRRVEYELMLEDSAKAGD
ncbi:MAG TPA: ATP-binding cassette domain-containing protein [Xanthobacteraceae bacterium]